MPPMPGARDLLRSRWLGWLLAGGIFVAAGLALGRQWSGVTAQDLPGLPVLAAVVGLHVVANAVLAGTWRRLLLVAGHQLARLPALRVWTLSQVARYGLGSAQLLGRAAAGRAYGLPASVSVFTTLVEIGWQFSLTVGLALAMLPWWATEAPAYRMLSLLGVVPLGVLAVGLLSPDRLLDLLRAVLRSRVVQRLAGRLASTGEHVSLTRGTSLRITAAYAGNLVLRVGAFLLLFAALGGDDVLRALGAYALGQIAGRVAVFAPGGIGAREGVTLLVLGPVLGTGPAVVLVALSRLLEMVAEVLLVLLALVWRGTPSPSGASEHA